MCEISNELELKELLSQAKKAISNNRCFFRLDSNTLLEEFLNLNMGDIQEIWPLLSELLQEIEPRNYFDPSAKEFSIGDKLVRFIWKSSKMKKMMELQFSIKTEIFYYFSLRPYRKKRHKPL